MKGQLLGYISAKRMESTDKQPKGQYGFLSGGCQPSDLPLDSDKNPPAFGTPDYLRETLARLQIALEMAAPLCRWDCVNGRPCWVEPEIERDIELLLSDRPPAARAVMRVAIEFEVGCYSAQSDSYIILIKDYPAIVRRFEQLLGEEL